VGEELVPSLLGHCKQKQRWLRGLLCRWPSITEWEMYITAQGTRLRNDLYCVEWDVKLYYTIPYQCYCQYYHYYSVCPSLLTAIFQVDPGYPVPECLHSGCYWSEG